MRRTLMSGLVAGALLTSTAGTAAAQDSQRVEVPEAGIAVSFPADWDAEVEMYLQGDPGSEYWMVLSGYDEADGWCDISRRPDVPITALDHASYVAVTYEEQAGPGMSVESTGMQLDIGPVYRVDKDDPDAGEYLTRYLFDSDTALYTLTCFASVPDPGRWLGIAETLEWLPEEDILELPGTEPEPAGAQRVEVPEAGIAIAFPGAWDVEVEMEYGQAQLGDPYSGYWDVIDAGDDAQDCYVRWDLYPGASMAELADFDPGEAFDEMGYDADAEITSVELPVGTVYRLDAYEPMLGLHSSSYEFDSDDTRISLGCYSETPDDDHWIDIASGFEWLPGGPSLERPVLPELNPGVRITLRPEPYELERIEMLDVGIAMLMPPEWELEAMMEEREMELPPDRAEDGPALYLDALYAEGDSGDWCTLRIYRDNPLTIWEHRDWLEADYEADAPEGLHVSSIIDLVGDEIGHRMDLISETDRGVVQSYVFESDSTRYVLSCGSDVVANPGWRTMAGSVESLGFEPEPGPDTEPTPDVVDDIDDIDDEEPYDLDELGLKWIDVSEAGVSLLLPPDWPLEVPMERKEFELPDDYADAGPASFVDAFIAESDTGEFCVLHVHDQNPMTLADHSVWNEAKWAAAFPDVDVERYQPDLWAGPGYAITIRSPGVATGATLYLFELDGLRYEVQCSGPLTVSGVTDAVAGSLELLDAVPSDVSDEPVGQWESGPFDSLVNVSESAVMRASCQRAVWIEHADGTYEERIDCVPSDEPVDPSDTQGSVPTETVVLDGGECEWVSDFWLAEDGSEVWADAWATTVEPDGSVVGRSWYGAEELDCS